MDKFTKQICKRIEFDADSQLFDLKLLTPSDVITILRVKLINEQFFPRTGELRLLYARAKYVKEKKYPTREDPPLVCEIKTYLTRTNLNKK